MLSNKNIIRIAKGIVYLFYLIIIGLSMTYPDSKQITNGASFLMILYTVSSVIYGFGSAFYMDFNSDYEYFENFGNLIEIGLETNIGFIIGSFFINIIIGFLLAVNGWMLTCTIFMGGFIILCITNSIIGYKFKSYQERC